MPKILLVEDDPMISEIYQRKFSAAGFDVRIATSGKAVLDILLRESFDLVLLDIVLPEMSGMEILEKLRDPKSGYDLGTKIVMFSNLSEKDDRDKAVSLGASGFISKTDFSPSELIAEVSRFLRQFEAQEYNANRQDAETSDAPASDVPTVSKESGKINQ